MARPFGVREKTATEIYLKNQEAMPKEKLREKINSFCLTALKSLLREGCLIYREEKILRIKRLLMKYRVFGYRNTNKENQIERHSNV